jgi:hypothetical protein
LPSLYQEFKEFRWRPIERDVDENSYVRIRTELGQEVTEPWQFSASTNEHGRVHGFIIGNTFFIRWFDPEHKLYS